MAQRKFTTKFMKGIPRPTKRERDKTYMDTRDPGKALVLRVSYGGTMTWKILFYVQRLTDGKTVPRAKKIGEYPQLSENEAYQKLKEFNPDDEHAASRAGTFGAVAEKWLAGYVRKKGLRSAQEIERQLRTYVLPRWADIPLYDIGLREVNELLDAVEDKEITNSKGQRLGGVSQADAVLATIRSLMVWWRSRDGKYPLPITKEMKLKRDHRSLEEKARDRVLDDDEIRAIWAATMKLANRGGLVRLFC
jgi:hypothetical protein